MNRFARRVVAAERKAHVRHPAADLGIRQVLAYPARGLDEIHRVVVVLFDAGGDRENIGIKDDVFRRETHFLRQQVVGALADFGLARKGIGLALFVESHHNHRRAVTSAQSGLTQKLGLTFLHADRVDHRLALHALQARFDHLPFRGVNHYRHARNIRLAREQIQEAPHGGLGIQHRLVHVDVDHLRAVFHLLACHGQRLIVLFVENQSCEGTRAGDVGALADIDEQ